MWKSKLFIDESGKASLKSSETFILTGVILEQRYKTVVEGYFNFIKRKYGINSNKPFHSYDIYEHPTKRLLDADLRKLSQEVADFISNIPVEIKIIGINKKRLCKALGLRSFDSLKTLSPQKAALLKESPYIITFSYLLEWFSMHLVPTRDIIGEIVAESRRAADKNLGY
ncbi:DUF3800 domain-containing protein [Candidatus Roizmanbacteria bacterium]|nr:DUF3800 domain-containing protein [Candidatus Roizmanbacteria bacterium]